MGKRTVVQVGLSFLLRKSSLLGIRQKWNKRNIPYPVAYIFWIFCSRNSMRQFCEFCVWFQQNWFKYQLSFILYPDLLSARYFFCVPKLIILFLFFFFSPGYIYSCVWFLQTLRACLQLINMTELLRTCLASGSVNHLVRRMTEVRLRSVRMFPRSKTKAFKNRRVPILG